jgi:beta-lactamase regulating signal transducer with metallopeptidase domain
VSLDLALRAAALLAAGTTLGWVTRSLSPSARHLLWHGTVMATLALPLTALVSPAWSVPGHLRQAAGLDAERVPIVETTESGRSAPVTATHIWIGGSGIVALYFLSEYARLARLRRRARPAPPAWSGAVAGLSARRRLTRQVEVLVSEAVRGPLVTGVGRVAVLIPPEACFWSDTRRDAVLIHELAHVGRGDHTAQLAAQALATLHWFNPLAWHALGAMRRERELACDEEVLRAGMPPLAYATELLAIAVAGAADPIPAAALSMARRSELEGRLSAVLAREPRHKRRGAGVGLSLLIVIVSVTLASARLTPPAPDPGSRASTARWTILPANDAAATPAPEGAVVSAADSETRQRATLMLAMTPGSAAIPSLLQALADPDARVREKAAVGLAWRRDNRVGPALVAATRPRRSAKRRWSRWPFQRAPRRRADRGGALGPRPRRA